MDKFITVCLALYAATIVIAGVWLAVKMVIEKRGRK